MQNDYLEEFLEIFTFNFSALNVIGLWIREAEPIVIRSDR